MSIVTLRWARTVFRLKAFLIHQFYWFFRPFDCSWIVDESISPQAKKFTFFWVFFDFLQDDFKFLRDFTNFCCEDVRKIFLVFSVFGLHDWWILKIWLIWWFWWIHWINWFVWEMFCICCFVWIMSKIV